MTVRHAIGVPSPRPVARYQYRDRRGSSTIEANELGQVISYEEYYPYGASAYRASKSGVDLSLKRYRFTGKERDSETGLDYFGVRYYASWLGRWTSSDPGGFVDGLNLYRYVRNNPVNGIDMEGYSTESVVEPNKEEKKKEEVETIEGGNPLGAAADEITVKASPIVENEDPPIFVFEGFGANTEKIRAKVLSAFEDMRLNGPEGVRNVMDAIANATDLDGNRVQITIRACPDDCWSPSVPGVKSLDTIVVLWPNSSVLETVVYPGKIPGTWVTDDFTSTLGNELKHVYDYVSGRIWIQQQAVEAIMDGRRDEIPDPKESVKVPGTSEVLYILELESNFFTNDIREWKGLPLEDAMTHIGGRKFDSKEKRDRFIKVEENKRKMEEMQRKMIEEMSKQKKNDEKK